MRVPLVFASTAGLLLLASPGSTSSSPASLQLPTFASGTDLVVMNVVVRDRGGVLVDGLTREAFTVYENGARREIGLFAHQEDPVTIGVVIDASGSMLASRARLAYVAGQFARSGRPDDEVFALVVGDAVTPVLPAERPFTNDPEELTTAILRQLGANGRTAIWDGVLEGLAYLERGSHARRALVVVSDGQDNASKATYDVVRARARASSAAIYTVGLIDPIRLERRPKSLRQLAVSTGGEAFFPETHLAAFDALRTVANQIHSTYTIGFSMPATAEDGRYHQLRVQVRARDGRTLNGRTRAGYVTASSAGSR